MPAPKASSLPGINTAADPWANEASKRVRAQDPATPADGRKQHHKLASKGVGSDGVSTSIDKRKGF